MFDWFWQILYCTSDIRTGTYSSLLNEIVFGQWYEDEWSLLFVYLMTLTSDIHTGAYSSFLDEIMFGQWYEDEWSLLFVYLMTLTSDTHTGAYSCLFDEIVFRQRYIDGWSLLVIYLMTLTSNLIFGHISPFSLSILKIGTTTNLVLDWVLVWGFQWLTVSRPSYMDLLR